MDVTVREIKHRNKPSHYTKDIHIRLREETERQVREKASELNMTTAKLLRSIIEKNIENI